MGVDDASQERLADAEKPGCADQADAAPPPHARHVTERVDDRLMISKPDHLAPHAGAKLPLDLHDGPDRRREAGDRRRQAVGLDDAAHELGGHHLGHQVDERVVHAW